ncbi:MAG: hypothetical protein JSS32_07855 [Verrucomicrobia bacterium]|nr:hypothetical protein [Verrucomicrobiota bacterium]
MKKLLATLQVLALCSLAAQDEQAAQSQDLMKKSDPCKTECKDPCACFEKGDDPLEKTPMSCKGYAAYNYPANIKVDKCWDFFIDGSYLYWYSNEDGLNIGSYQAMNPTTLLVSLPVVNGFEATHHPTYKNGFKVNVGCNLNNDDWVMDLGYTWYRSTTTTLHAAPTPSTTQGGATTGVFALSNWYFQTNTNNQFPAATVVNSEWKLGLDWLDWMFSRPFYQGRKLTVIPSGGLRGSWIRQSFLLTSNIANFDTSTLSPQIGAHSHNHYNSWAVGPRGLVETHWILGAGFRGQGSFGGSLLYTRYTKIYHQEDQLPTSGTALGHPVTYKYSNLSTLRPMIEANLGIGFGSYFMKKRYHFDLSATYDFNYLFFQNMLQYVADLNVLGNGTPGNLYLHGLTVKTRFDF